MIKDILQEIRVKHWLKNIFVLAPLLFTPEKWSAGFLGTVLIGVLSFCFISSSVYIVNDLHDISEDRKSTVNSKRPYASGKFTSRYMFVIFGMLIFFGLTVGFIAGNVFLLIIIIYLALNITYTFLFKRLKYINYTTVALGFVLRVLGGCFIIGATPSVWIVTLTFLLTYFISYVKFYINNVTRERDDLIRIYLISATIVFIYVLYTISGETRMHFGGIALIFSAIPVTGGFLYTGYKLKVERGKDIVNFFTDKVYWSIYFVWLLSILGVVGKKYF